MADADVATKGAGETDPVHGGDTHLVHQELYAGIERRFGELNLSHVVLGHQHIGHFRIAGCVQYIREGAPVGLNALGALSQCAVHDAVGGEYAGEVHLGDYLNNPRAANARHTCACHGLGKAGFV